MSSEVSQDAPQAEVIYEAVIEESSEDPPMDEWSSLDIQLPEENVKRALFADGLYHPGSGEVCAQYVKMSDSAVFVHPFYNYPGITDPGIKEALLDPPDEIIYADDGQELYLAVCKEMDQCPVRIFQRGLAEQVIDLRYYCVNPFGVRAMTLALQYNRNVKELHLTDNFLNDDACYHIGQMLTTNSCLYELNLSGCRIGESGAMRLFAGLCINRSLKVLNLNGNKLGDAGVEHLANAISTGIDVQKIYLSNNSIGSTGAGALAEAFEYQNKCVVLDLSWNNLFSPVGFYNLLCRLSENKYLQELYLSWNSIAGARLGLGIKTAMAAPNLRHLDLSNNKLTGEPITLIISVMGKAKKLMILDLSFNPLTTHEALNLLTKVKTPAVKLQTLIMENVMVDKEFLVLLDAMKQMKSKRNVAVTYGGVVSVSAPKGADPREVLLNRADFLSKKQKRATTNLGLVVLQLAKDHIQIMNSKDFTTVVTNANLPFDADLVEEIINVFSGPRTPKAKTIDISLLADYIKRKWPDCKLPPTPPPEPEPIPVPTPAKKTKGKEKKGE